MTANQVQRHGRTPVRQLLARQLLACCLVLGGLGVALPATASAAPGTTACELITARQLTKVFDRTFTPEAGGASVCVWLSEHNGLLTDITVTFNDSLSAEVVAADMKAERQAAGAVVLKGIGDLTIMSPGPRLDTSGNPSVAVSVYEGTIIAQVAVITEDTAPTTKQMRRLAKWVAKRLR